MIDKKYQVRRFVAEFSESTEEQLAQYYFNDFNLKAFQKEFNEDDSQNPMFECYPIKKEHLQFLRKYLENEPDWDFIHKSYFVEASAI